MLATRLSGFWERAPLDAGQLTMLWLPQMPRPAYGTGSTMQQMLLHHAHWLKVVLASFLKH